MISIKQFLAKQKAKGKLIQVFKSGELYLTFKKDSTVRYIMPQIHYVGIDQNKKQLTYEFSIPLGLDPKEVLKKEWLFKQQFGKNLEIDQENKRFTLRVYSHSIPKELPYNLENIKTLLKNVEEEIILPIVCGADINGNVLIYDLVTFPHLLISGRTGSGKSTQVRSILTTLINLLPPDKLHLYLADLKMAEFQMYRNIAHVQELTIRTQEVIDMLQRLETELEKRQELLVKEDVLHIKDLQNKVPYIIIAIDELASLRNDDNAMEILEEISNRGRALGIYLIISILRPDSKLMDSRLKNNLNVVMGFRCKDAINARVIGTMGAEKLTNKGRFLIDIEMLEGLPEIQAPYLTDTKAKKLLEPYKVDKLKESETVALKESKEDEVKEQLKDLFGSEETCENETNQSVITWRGFDV